MKHLLSRCVAVVALVFIGCFGASAVFAAGLNLGWGAFCPTNAGSAIDASDPCDGTSGATYQLIGSIRPAVALTDCVAEEMSLDIQETAAVLSDYWHLENENQPGQVNVAGCRGTDSGSGNIGSLDVNASNAALPTNSPCIKFWGTPAGGVNWLTGVRGPDTGRLLIKESKSPGTAMVANSQYYSFSALIDTNHQLAVADPGGVYPAPFYLCAGCADGVCIVFNQCILRQPPGTPGGDISLDAQDVRQYVTWQAGAGQSAQCQAVPVKRASWGQVKSLYR